MKVPEDSVLVRIFIGEDDRWHGHPLYEQIVKKARELDLAGATVIRGIIGFGAHSRIHTTKLLSLSEDLPIVVEVVDACEKIDKFLPFLDEVIQEGMVTLENIKVLKYRHAGRPKHSKQNH
jgi:PII-like signaling protein